jgi:hypothetical protein
LKALRTAIDVNYKGLVIIPNMSSGDVFAHGLNERLPVKSFYDNLHHWYVLLKAITG